MKVYVYIIQEEGEPTARGSCERTAVGKGTCVKKASEQPKQKNDGPGHIGPGQLEEVTAHG
jgi:hypothetical protein